jgi:bifunctional enzyme CysN/CysC
MDLIEWDQQPFEAIRSEFHAFAARLNVHDVTTIPMSALHGDNVVTKSDRTPWYEGPALLSHLEGVYIAGDRNLVDVRFPVQYVIRPQTVDRQDYRGYAGTVASGVMRVGDDVIVLPSGKTSRITAIDGPEGLVQQAFPPMAVSISLADNVDISRGDVIARINNQPRVTQEFDATVCWMADTSALEPGRDYVIKHTTKTTRARVTALDYRLDVNTLHRDQSATALKLNELGRITLRTQAPLMLDEYTRNSSTGSFILIDPDTDGTVAAGMVLRDVSARDAAARASSPNTVKHKSLVTAAERLSQGATVWFTGLSGSGKSSVATLAERKLLEAGRPAYVLDGDNLRHGLNADLGFSMADRAENQRRLAHVAKLLADCGQVVLVPAISPLTEHREGARRVHEEAGVPFFEVFCDTSLEDCEKRDPKGLYAKARAGQIKDFTGIDSPYEPPQEPDLRLQSFCTADELAQQIVDLVLAVTS